MKRYHSRSKLYEKDVRNWTVLFFENGIKKIANPAQFHTAKHLFFKSPKEIKLSENESEKYQKNLVNRENQYNV